MSDTLTNFLSLVKQTIGGNRNTWGAILNTNMDKIEAGIAGLFAKVVTGGSYTLLDTEWPNRMMQFSGTLGSNQIIVVPNNPAFWLVDNATAGAFTLTFKTAGGAAIGVPQGTTGLLWCDGADVCAVITANDLGISEITFAMLASSMIANQAQAQGLTASNVLMTPQRVWDAIWAFDAPLLVVIDKDTLTPPGSPAEGDRYFVGGTGLSDWVGFDNTVVEYRNAEWAWFAPTTEQRIVVADEKHMYRWTGSALVIDLPYFPVLAPAQITANQNDYQPTGRTSSSVLVLDFDAARSITGIVPNFDGELLGLFNGSAFAATLSDASSSSSANNRFSFGRDLTLGAGKSCVLVYQAGSVNRWKLLVEPSLTKNGAIIPFSQCRLAKSGSNLVLSPYNGNLLTINGAAEVIPDAGVSLAGAGSAGSVGYIYAYMNSGTMTLESSATAYAVQAGTGMRIKSGDATRTLVGMARPGTGPAWVDTVTQRFVRSWFNDPGIVGKSNFSTDRSTTSTSTVELNTEIRVEFLSWAAEIVRAEITGSVSIGGSIGFTLIGIDGTTPEDTVSEHQGASQAFPISAMVSRYDLAEGYHYATLLARTSSGNTCTWIGSATPGLRTVLDVTAGRH